MIEFRVDTKELEKARFMLQDKPSEFNKAVKRAQSRAISSARTEAVKEARETYDTKAATLRSSIILKKSEGTMISKGSPMELIKFKVSPNSPNAGSVRASVKKVGGQIGYAFIAQMPNGHIGVYKRTGKRNYPIRQLYSVSTAQMIGEDKVIDKTEKRAKEVFEERLNHEIDRVLTRF